MRILRYDDSIPINLDNLTAIEIKSMDSFVLGNVVPGAEPRIQTFITIRDNAMSMLIFNNCSRPGKIYNMNLGELRDGEEDGNGGFNVQVFNHKTDLTVQ